MADGKGYHRKIITRVAPNERMMISVRGPRKGDKIETRGAETRDALAAATIPPSLFSAPFFLYPFYTDVPLNVTYGSPFHKVASRIFVGWRP